MNGAAKLEDVRGAALDGWAIVWAFGLTLIGKIVRGDYDTLSPVYELRTLVGRQEEGLAINRTCNPVGWFSSVRELPIPPSALAVPVSDLAPDERKVLSRAVLACDDLVRQMRAQSSGIAVVHDMPKRPPMGRP